jgi:membrane associated rhomboid family serine protease
MTAPGQDTDPGQQTPPTCFRHPNRETWVSCVRCGRHACPDCLREASVGQQCVECVREASRGNGAARTARTVLGGRPSSTAIVTWTILGINVLLYLVELGYSNLANDWAMWGYGVAQGQWYRLITAAFLPGTGTMGLLDIAFNMWALYVVGPPLEQLLGKARYIALYVLSAIGGNILFYYLVSPDQAAIGASGAIFGLFAALFVVARRLRLNMGGIATVIVVNLVFSFVIAQIAWQAHVGGLIVGAALAAAYAYAPRRGQAVIQVGATVAMIVILAVATIIRNGQIPI